MRDQRVMAKDRDQHETLADLSPEESGWFSASLKHPEAKPEEVIEELREAIPIQMVHVAVAGAGLCPLDAMRLRGVSAAQELFTLDPSAFV